MTNIGSVVVQAGSETFILRPLTVRQFVTMQSLMGARKAVDTIADCKTAGMSPQEAIAEAQKTRDRCMLTSSIIRWCFELEGASTIVGESCSNSGVDKDRVLSALTPDEVTEYALQLVGFQWDASQSKWVSRSSVQSGAGIG